MIRYSVRVSTTILAFNCAVLTMLALTSSLQATLYTLVYRYVTSRMVNLVLSGLSHNARRC